MPAADGGALGNPVILRGIKVGGQRPHLRGGVTTGSPANTIEVQANHVVFESFELSGTGNITTGTFRCFFHHSHAVVIRDAYIHDCPRQGVLGADTDSGSLTIEYTEIFNAGSNGGNHAVYMATNEDDYPGSVFRLQYSYLHDSDFPGGNPGNLIKSRAERNEIYYNWLEDAGIHELELIGPDPAGGVAENTAREDSDVVGNVIVHRSTFNAIRVGGDGTGQSNGRYRFVNNTIVFVGVPGANTPAAWRTHFGIESLEMHNNVVWRDAAGVPRIWREESPTNWVFGAARIHGTNNWIKTGATFVPAGWSVTLTGADPGFVSAAGLDFRPAAGSPLLETGAQPPVTPPEFAIANPVFPPVWHPSARALMEVGTAQPRPASGTLDIGAYEGGELPLFSNGFE